MTLSKGMCKKLPWRGLPGLDLQVERRLDPDGSGWIEGRAHSLSKMSALPDPSANVSEIRTNQFVAFSAPRMHGRGRLENQIAICIERSEKAFFVMPEMRFHPLKSIDGDKEGIFDRGVVSPKTYSLPGSIITSAVIRKFQGHCILPFGWRASIAKPRMQSTAINRETARCAQCLTIV